MSENPPILLSIAIQTSNGPLSLEFKSIEETVYWLKSEYQKWTWLVQTPQRLSRCRPIIENNFASLVRCITRMEEAVNTIKLIDDNPGVEIAGPDIRDLEKSFENAISAGSIYSWTIPGKRVLSLLSGSTDSKVFAAYVFLLYSGVEFEKELERRAIHAEGQRENTNPDFIGAAAWAKMSQYGLPNSTSQIVTEASNHLRLTQTIEKETQDTLLVAKKGSQQVIDLLGTLTDQVDDWIRDQNGKFEKEHLGHVETLGQLRSEFYEHLALSSASQYWSEENKRQEKLMKTWGKLCSAWGALICAILLLKMSYLCCYPPQEIVTKDNLLGYVITFTAPFAIIVGLAIWALRILIRTYLSHAHLAADARERELLVTSCVALLRSAEISTASENKELRSLVLGKALESVFRHTQDGMVKDDAFSFGGMMNLVR